MDAATSLERQLIAALGPRSGIATATIVRLMEIGVDPPAEVYAVWQDRIVGALDQPRAFANHLFLLVVFRSLLLSSVRVTRLSSAPWGLPDRTPCWDWLEDVCRELKTDAIDSAVSSVLLSRDEREGDPLRTLFEAYVPAPARKRRGEHFTPSWLADHVIDCVWRAGGRWLDPTAGVGSFALALARRSRQFGEEMPEFVGIEQDVQSFLGAAASIAWGRRRAANPLLDDRPIGVVLGDILREDPWKSAARGFDRVIGNPPWVLWDRYTPDERKAMMGLWRHHGLQAEQGMRSILGSGKRDMATLVTLIAADRWLADGGKLCFVLPSSAFKSTSSAKGFRQFRLPGGEPLSVEGVDDLTLLKPFPQANVKAVVATFEKGRPAEYPVRYFVWRTSRRTEADRYWARPSDERDATSAWVHFQDSRDGTAGIVGRCEYEAHLGVNTGGANGVYWMRKIEEQSPTLWRMANLSDRGKRRVELREVEIESEFLFPALLGRDVRAWRAVPSAWLLLVQDPQRRRGIAEEALCRQAPRTLDYLRSVEGVLRRRAAFRRYFCRPGLNGGEVETGPFYSMFNVGGYTLSRWKVVWNRMGHQFGAAVVGDCEGRLVLPQETHAFIGVDEAEEAYYVAALLNSSWVQLILERSGPVGGKSFATPGAIARVRIERFRPMDKGHQALVELGREATRLGAAGPIGIELSERIRRVSAEYWGIPDHS